jgi:hypothetical protein
MRWQLAFAVAVLSTVTPSPATAFEVKGYTPGMEISKVDLTGCTKIDNADSGVPGFRCDTTLGGDKAQLRLTVFEGKVVGVIFIVREGRMTPTLDALSQKYGRPSKRNRYSEEYDWTSGDIWMTISEEGRGYSVLVVDHALSKRERAAAANKAKKDI